ncbi:hypothetical protein MCJ35_21745 [Enterocloster sp. OA13]|uniref:hypothetical protein n=1 Tax=Enterocloster sp. OA13 TaxID=2914161 RepID=UPI0004716BB4|nr:hypothetical protein [Enterocloster sp. OA13]
MKLTEVQFQYSPGSYSYNQGVRGRHNYNHKTGNRNYNGFGGYHEFTGSELRLSGFDESGKVRNIDVKEEILDLFSRKRLGESFVNKLNARVPDAVDITINEDGMVKFSRDVRKALKGKKK